jgi:hypothetical protein
VFPRGLKVSLPTDQIISPTIPAVTLELGLAGCVRIRELFPEDRLSAARSHRMLLDPQWVPQLQ